MMTVNGGSDFFNSSISNCSFTGTPLTSCLSPWHIAASVVLAVSCLLGIPANIAVIVKLSRHLRGSSMSQRLFFNLAVSDLFCLLCLPVGMVVFLIGPRLTHGMCQLLFYFFFFCITSDLNILVLISIQRYYQVLHTEKWENVRRRWQRLLLFSVWMLGALMALPVVFFHVEAENKDQKNDHHSCKNQRVAPLLEVFYICFIVSCHLILLSFYLLLVKGLKRKQSVEPAKKTPRATKLFIRIITVSLVNGFFPLVVRLLYVVSLFTASDKLLYISKMLTFVECFYFFNYCLNPFLYFFASRHYRNDSSNKKKRLLMPLNDNF